MAEANGIDFDSSGASLPQFERRGRLFKITSGTNPYAAAEVWLNEATGATADNGGWPATVANKSLWEVNGVATVAADTVVEGWPNPFGSGFYFTNGSAIGPRRLLSSCLIRNGSSGAITGMRQVWVKANSADTECVQVDDCPSCGSGSGSGSG